MKKEKFTLDGQGDLNRGKRRNKEKLLVSGNCHTGYAGMLRARELRETEVKPLSYYPSVLFPP